MPGNSIHHCPADKCHKLLLLVCLACTMTNQISDFPQVRDQPCARAVGEIGGSSRLIGSEEILSDIFVSNQRIKSQVRLEWTLLPAAPYRSLIVGFPAGDAKRRLVELTKAAPGLITRLRDAQSPERGSINAVKCYNFPNCALWPTSLFSPPLLLQLSTH